MKCAYSLAPLVNVTIFIPSSVPELAGEMLYLYLQTLGATWPPFLPTQSRLGFNFLFLILSTSLKVLWHISQHMVK